MRELLLESKGCLTRRGIFSIVVGVICFCCGPLDCSSKYRGWRLPAVHPSVRRRPDYTEHRDGTAGLSGLFFCL